MNKSIAHRATEDVKRGDLLKAVMRRQWPHFWRRCMVGVKSYAPSEIGNVMSVGIAETDTSRGYMVKVLIWGVFSDE